MNDSTIYKLTVTAPSGIVYQQYYKNLREAQEDRETLQNHYTAENIPVTTALAVS